MQRNCSALPVSAFVASARVCDLLLGVKHVFVVATCLPLLGERSARHNESRAGLPAKFTDVIDNQERRETCEHGANSCSGSARPRAALPSLSYLVSARVRDLYSEPNICLSPPAAKGVYGGEASAGVLGGPNISILDVCTCNSDSLNIHRTLRTSRCVLPSFQHSLPLDIFQRFWRLNGDQYISDA